MNLTEFTQALPKGTTFELRTVAWENNTELRFELETPDDIDKDTGAGKGLLTILLTGVVEFYSHTNSEDTLVDELLCTTDHPLLWHYGTMQQIFGNAPLPDDHRFYAQLSALLESTFGPGHPPSRYLNWQGSYNNWRTMVTNRTYLLLTCPTPLASKIAALLEVQAAEYHILEDKNAIPLPGMLLVKVGNSWAVCRNAEAVPRLAT